MNGHFHLLADTPTVVGAHDGENGEGGWRMREDARPPNGTHHLLLLVDNDVDSSWMVVVLQPHVLQLLLNNYVVGCNGFHDGS